MNQSDFGKRLSAVREFRSLSQEELARKTGFQPSNISHFECGRRQPNLVSLCKLADALTVSTDYLLGRTYILAPGPANPDCLAETIFNLSSSDYDLVVSFVNMLRERKNSIKFRS